MAGKAREADGDPVVAGLKQVVQTSVNLQMEATAGQHQQFLATLQRAVMEYLQKHQQEKAAAAAQGQVQQAQQAAMGAPQGMPGQGGPGGMSPQGPPRGGPGGPPSQGMPGLQMPNPDELRRALSGGQAA